MGRLASGKFAAVIGEIVTLTTEAHTLVEFGTTPEMHTKIGKEGDVFMPLSIESMVWAYPDGAVSVMHWYIMNGDLMHDPMVVVTPQGEPLEFQQDGIGGGYERWEQGTLDAQKTDLIQFLDIWTDNLRATWLPMAQEVADKAA
jgi:hypothetical protein